MKQKKTLCEREKYSLPAFAFFFFLAQLFWKKKKTSRYCHDLDVVSGGVGIGVDVITFNLGHISVIEDTNLKLGAYVHYQKSNLYHQVR